MKKRLIIGVDARPAVWHRGTGIGNYTHQLVEYLGRVDTTNSYRLAWPTDEPAPPLPRGWKATPVPRRRRAEAPALVSWLREEQVDVYHVPQNGLHAPPDLGRARLVVTIHDLIPWVLPECVRHGYLHRFLREVPDVLAAASAVIAVSRQTARDLVRILAVEEAKIHVVYPAPEEIFHPVAAHPAGDLLRGKYGIDGPFAVYVGGLNPRKNVSDLIYAFSKVCRRLVPQIRLFIAGGQDGQHRELMDFARLAGAEEYITAPGEVPLGELPAIYSAAVMAIYPSLYEGFGLPPLEAMACGTPVICSDAGSLPEVVGRAAYMVPAGDVTALAEAIRRLAEDEALRGRLRERGLARVARYSWPRAVRSILNVYRSVVAQEEVPEK